MMNHVVNIALRMTFYISSLPKWMDKKNFLRVQSCCHQISFNKLQIQFQFPHFRKVVTEMYESANCVKFLKKDKF